MPILINLHAVEKETIAIEGELPVEDLDIKMTDDVIRLSKPMTYSLNVEWLHGAILATGHLQLPLDCTCVRCLKAFVLKLDLAGWACHLPLEGEDSVSIEGHSVDLTPFVREDIVLSLPQHPLCEPECPGLLSVQLDTVAKPSGEHPEGEAVSPWAELGKLKL
jgi:uncharacterized protein